MRASEQKQNRQRERASTDSALPGAATHAPGLHTHPAQHLHRAFGNHAVRRLVQAKIEVPKVEAKKETAEHADSERKQDDAAYELTGAPRPSTERQPPADTRPPAVARKADGEADSVSSHINAGALDGHGEPIEPGAARALSHRFGFDLGAVRVHDGPASAGSARSLGARAYTLGTHVVFGGGEYQPQTARGRSLLAHELTHVGQHLAGSDETHEAQERQADAVEAGASFASNGSGVSRAALRLRPGDALSLTVTAGGPSGAASFSAQVEGGGAVTASGSVTQLEPGEYRLRISGRQISIIRADGTPVPNTSRFDMAESPANAALVRALLAASAIPMQVVSRPVGGGTGEGTGEAPTPPTPEEAQRRELDALPERIRNFLFRPGGPPARPEDYPALLRIARSVADLSEAELAEFRARTTGSTTDVAAFEASVNRWLTELRAHRTAERDLDTATQALFGMDAIYEMYRSYSFTASIIAPPAQINEWEAMPVSALPATHEGSQMQNYLDMRRGLARFGYANLAAFATAIRNFLTAFRENAYYIALDLLDRYEHTLVEQQTRYRASTASLFSSLAPARATFHAADEYRDAAQAQYGGSWDPEDVMNYHAAGEEHQRQRAVGRSEVAAQAADHPLLGSQDFPREEIGRATGQTEVTRIMTDYIRSGLEHVSDTRTNLRDDHEVIFKLDLLVAQTKARQGIGPNSVWSRIIADHQAPTVDQVMLDVMIGVIALGLGLMSGGSALAAVGSLGLSSFLAIQQYQDYAFRSDAYGAQLLSEEPSLAWVVIAIVGVALDFAVVSRVIRPIRPALQEFQRTGDVAALEAQLGGVEERIRRSIIARARLESQARQGWQGLFPPGALRGSFFGLDLMVEGLGKVVYSIQLNLRRGINTFNRWALTREAVDLIGDINRLTPEELTRVRAVYQQAVGDAERIAAHGRSLNMPDADVDAAIQSWARRGSGNADDVMREMTAARATSPEAPAAPPPAAEPPPPAAVEPPTPAVVEPPTPATPRPPTVVEPPTPATPTTPGTTPAAPTPAAPTPAAPVPAWTPPFNWKGPSRHGRWVDPAARGNTGWIDDRPEVIRVVGRDASGQVNPVPFRNGVADFSQWAQREVTVPGASLLGQRARRAGVPEAQDEMRRIYLAIADDLGLAPGASPSARQTAALDWLRTAPDGYGGVGLAPHHAGGNRIQLVPRSVHNIQHTDITPYPAPGAGGTTGGATTGGATTGGVE